MKRTRSPIPKARPDLILCADFHLREDTPLCRTDDFWEAQWEKVDAIRAMQQRYDCPVIHAGDLYHHWKASPYLLTQTLCFLPDNFKTIYGNHDVPQHNLNFIFKTGVKTLVQANRIVILPGVHWEKGPTGKEDLYFGTNKMGLVWHVMTWLGEHPWPGCTDPSADELLAKYPEYNLIVTGHNHKSFTAELDGRLLVNPGSLTRQTADQINHRPCVYLWYAATNEVEPVYLPIEQGVISREHIEKNKERDVRMEAFIAKLDGEWESELNFEQNLERFFAANKVKAQVKQIVMEAVEEG